ncbi:RhoGAP domain protein [Ancylostoma caninum]|uniref:RhoGAP domain protein n=1 Tax=Ancylostoma caninum TaxID=29170 RepID=A0A368GT23_ANCCA|nr:RhoGAP domain protein [Ancylostoma caninum]
MEKAKKDVGQKFRRIKHNLVNSTKKDDDDDLKIVNALEHRNQKVISAVTAYRKHVSNTVKTGLREENVDKRRSTNRFQKKLDEFSLCAELREISTELEVLHTTCLHKVIQKISQALQVVVDEKVKHDMMIEKRVLDDLVQFQDMEKALCKSRERLNNAFTDVDIAKKALEKADSTSSNIPQLQDTLDAAQLKLENQKDNTITDVYSLAAKEQEIAKVFTALLEEQLEYHRVAMRTLEMVLPEIRRDIDNARPRPVFGVDLTEHLRHTQGRVAVVLEKCCSMLRASGFTEKGNTLPHQFLVDERAYYLDPHSVCSVLKSYLRELPDPLLTHRLHNEWVNAAKLEDEAKLQAFERCIGELPACHRHNLTYLINFLSEMLQHQEQTAMNCGNLAIVFGPNLLGGDIDGNNAVGTKIVETLLKHASRLFGCPVVNNGNGGGHQAAGRSLTVDTNSPPKPGQSRERSEYGSISSWGTSPRGRPKERAPPPPYVTPKTGSLIDLSDECNNTDQTAHTSTTARIDPSLTQSQSLMSADLSESFGMSPTATAESDDSFDEYQDESLPGSMSRSQGDIAAASLTTPQRPPPPVLLKLILYFIFIVTSVRKEAVFFQTFRNGSESSNNRPLSYNKAVGAEPIPVPRSRTSRSVVMENNSSSSSGSGSIKRPSILNREDIVGADVSNSFKTVVAVEAPPLPARNKPPLPAKPRSGDNETSRL